MHLIRSPISSGRIRSAIQRLENSLTVGVNNGLNSSDSFYRSSEISLHLDSNIRPRVDISWISHTQLHALSNFGS